MAKVVFALGVVIGLAILAIAATAEPNSSGLLAGVAGTYGSQAGAMSVTKGSCTTREIALDQGYGVTRKIFRKVCHIDD